MRFRFRVARIRANVDQPRPSCHEHRQRLYRITMYLFVRSPWTTRCCFSVYAKPIARQILLRPVESKISRSELEKQPFRAQLYSVPSFATARDSSAGRSVIYWPLKATVELPPPYRGVTPTIPCSYAAVRRCARPLARSRGNYERPY